MFESGKSSGAGMKEGQEQVVIMLSCEFCDELFRSKADLWDHKRDCSPGSSAIRDRTASYTLALLTPETAGSSTQGLQKAVDQARRGPQLDNAEQLPVPVDAANWVFSINDLQSVGVAEPETLENPTSDDMRSRQSLIVLPDRSLMQTVAFGNTHSNYSSLGSGQRPDTLSPSNNPDSLAAIAQGPASQDRNRRIAKFPCSKTVPIASTLKQSLPESEVRSGQRCSSLSSLHSNSSVGGGVLLSSPSNPSSGSEIGFVPPPPPTRPSPAATPNSTQMYFEIEKMEVSSTTDFECLQDQNLHMPGTSSASASEDRNPTLVQVMFEKIPKIAPPSVCGSDAASSIGTGRVTLTAAGTRLNSGPVSPQPRFSNFPSRPLSPAKCGYCGGSEFEGLSLLAHTEVCSGREACIDESNTKVSKKRSSGMLRERTGDLAKKPKESLKPISERIENLPHRPLQHLLNSPTRSVLPPSKLSLLSSPNAREYHSQPLPSHKVTFSPYKPRPETPTKIKTQHPRNPKSSSATITSCQYCDKHFDELRSMETHAIVCPLNAVNRHPVFTFLEAAAVPVPNAKKVTASQEVPSANRATRSAQNAATNLSARASFHQPKTKSGPRSLAPVNGKTPVQKITVASMPELIRPHAKGSRLAQRICNLCWKHFTTKEEREAHDRSVHGRVFNATLGASPRVTPDSHEDSSAGRTKRASNATSSSSGYASASNEGQPIKEPGISLSVARPPPSTQVEASRQFECQFCWMNFDSREEFIDHTWEELTTNDSHFDKRLKSRSDKTKSPDVPQNASRGQKVPSASVSAASGSQNLPSTSNSDASQSQQAPTSSKSDPSRSQDAPSAINLDACAENQIELSRLNTKQDNEGAKSSSRSRSRGRRKTHTVTFQTPVQSDPVRGKRPRNTPLTEPSSCSRLVNKPASIQATKSSSFKKQLPHEPPSIPPTGSSAQQLLTQKQDKMVTRSSTRQHLTLLPQRTVVTRSSARQSRTQCDKTSTARSSHKPSDQAQNTPATRSSARKAPIKHQNSHLTRSSAPQPLTRTENTQSTISLCLNTSQSQQPQIACTRRHSQDHGSRTRDQYMFKVFKACYCKDCNKDVSNRTKLLQCKQCPVKLIHKEDLKKHVEGHSLRKPLLCMTCGQWFQLSTQIKRHLQQSHRSN